MNAEAPAKPLVPFWKTQMGEAEAEAARRAVLAGRISQGALTAEFEAKLAAMLGVPHVVCTTSCSMALYLAFSALEIGPGDEVIVPNRTYIATAHAALLRGAKVKLVDCRRDDTLIDETLIEKAITKRTKAIVPVHLNGKAADLKTIQKLAKKHGLKIVEDAAQAFLSRDEHGFLGTQADLGCFSLGPTKFITTGQGGFVATRSAELNRRLRRFRNQGVDDVFSADFQSLGFNLKFSDVLAAVGLAQLDRVEEKRKKHLWFYDFYAKALAGVPYLKLLPVDLKRGNLPLWVEVLVPEREKWLALMEAQGIQARPFTPDLNLSKHVSEDRKPFANSKYFSDHGAWVPCGPDLALEDYERTVAVMKSLTPKIKERLER